VQVILSGTSTTNISSRSEAASGVCGA